VRAGRSRGGAPGPRPFPCSLDNGRRRSRGRRRFSGDGEVVLSAPSGSRWRLPFSLPASSLPPSPRYNGAEQQLPAARWGHVVRSAHTRTRWIWSIRARTETSSRA
jgi:hypothetical protein